MGGSLSGGWLSSFLIRSGASVNVARKTALWTASLAVVPMIFAYQVSGLWPTVLILGMAAAGHQAFSANIYTVVGDMFPKRAIASVSGLGGMFGYLSAALFQPFVGWCVQIRHSYVIPFACAGSAYIVANICLQILVPRLEPADMEDKPTIQGFPVLPVDEL
jgi:MFS transporter, ACS family, hexuronate transporter